MRLAVLFIFGSAFGFAQWPQWGGPNRNFQVSSSPPLATTWPAAGPKRVWTRPLGEGFSGMVVGDGRLYTLHNRGNRGQTGDQEVVVAIDTVSGKTVWEFAYKASFTNDAEVGPGPHASPLLDGDRLYTVGVNARLHCLDARTGKVVWMHDLKSEYKSTHLIYGYASSPLLYKNNIVLPVGGENHALMAFDKMTGKLAWSTGTFTNAYSSPVLINVDGQDQIVTVMKQDVMSVDPNKPAVTWWHPQKAEYGLNVTMPVWGPGNLLFVSSSYSAGSKVLELHQQNGKTTVKQLWDGYRLNVHHTNVVRIGDVIYGSTGMSGPAPLTAVEVRTGKLLWQDRQFSKANMMVADGKVIVLDQDGNLALTVLSPQGCKVLAKAQVLEKLAWTPPVLAGTKLYVRDRKTLVALELGK
jgi:outer membrane protein assembly factor BamB